MASRDHDLYNNATGPHTRNAGSSWTPSPPNKSRTLSSDTTSLRSVRKRSSFFGRSNSDASSMRRAPATSHSAKSSFNQARIVEDASRPQTATSSDMRRRKTDPLQSIRDSIFGSKKKTATDRADSLSSRPSSRGGEAGLQSEPVHATSFNSEEDYYRHLRKQSISPPYNFQHVTHTARSQLPQLETVDEKDLPGQFWSVAAHQRPSRRVNGIKLDDLQTKHRQMNLIRESPEPSPAFSPPISPTQALSPLSTLSSTRSDLRLISPIPPISPLESQLPESFPGPQSFASGRDESSPRRMGPADPPVARHPRRNSSLGALKQHTQHPSGESAKSATIPNLRSHESFYDSNSSSESETRKASPRARSEAPPQKMAVPKLNASMPPNFSQDYDVAFRARQPLPSILPQPPAINMYPNRLEVAPSAPMSMVSPTLPPMRPTSPKSKRSSKSSRSAHKSPAASGGPLNFYGPSMFSVSTATWEEDVDLAYEQEAEATCDFSWTGQNQAPNAIAQKEASMRTSAATISQANSPCLTEVSTPSENGVSLHRNDSTDTISNAADARPKRGTSVGHRGFLAARKNSSSDLLSKAKEPPAPLHFSQVSTQPSALSPVFSVADEEAQKTPFTPASLQYPHIERVSNDYLSDPESYRNSNSSKHRKSSSYGSYGSYDSAGTRAGPPTVGSNTTRWSIASSGSMPELMHSRPKSKSSLSRSAKSQPLETVTQSPPGSGTESEFQHIPRSTQPEPARNSFIKRGSAESSDRVVVQAAGRAVQRGRPGSYARYSQHLEPGPPKGGVRESYTGGPDWI